MADAHEAKPADKILSALSTLLTELLAEPAARRSLRTFCLQVADSLDPGQPRTSDLEDTTEFHDPVQVRVPAAPPPTETVVPVDVVSSSDAIKQLKWAQSRDSKLTDNERQLVAERSESLADSAPKAGAWRGVSDQDLMAIPQRCQLKAEACRWKLERRRLLEAGRRFAEEIEPRDKDLIARAKSLPDCFLWMNWQDGPIVGASTAWDALAECFEALGEAVSLLQESAASVEEFPDLFKEMMVLTAEAQSAVRSGAREVHYEDEPEQDRTYNWLKRTAAERGQYISRYMRVDDPADPTQSADLKRRLADFRQRFETRRNLDRVRRKRLGQLKYIAGQIQQDLNGDQSYNWQKLVAAVDELVASGEQPSSREIRKHLLPILDELPAGDLPPNVELVVREIDRYLGENPSEEPSTAASSRSTPAIREVAERLGGRSIVLIGGVRKPGHVAALQEAFQLKEVVWVPTKEHQSVTKFEPYVRQPDVALVVLAIRWTSHSYGEVKDYCEAYGKPFVRLKAGYNPTQVAAHILDQVSDQLPVPAATSESA